MTEENTIKLTNALYKVTDLFPKEEPLKFAIRKEGLDVLFFSNIIKGKSISASNKEKEQYFEKVMGKIELIKTYFNIAKDQEWVNAKNFLILENEYNNLKEDLKFKVSEFKSEIKEVRKPVVMDRIEKAEEPVAVMAGSQKEETKEEKKKEIEKREIKHINYEELSSIQLRVLEILQGKGQLKSNQISQFFPEMNPRTIRRELKGLKEMNILIAKGGGKTTVYEINQTY